jgi:Domain of unknown function (DUF4276)
VRLALFVEGKTEKLGLPEFFGRWLNPQLSHSLSIHPICLGGSADYRKDISRRARMVLQSPQILAAVGLIDLYGSGLAYPQGTIQEKYLWARQGIERQVNDPRFRQHFAVHEVEAWLLSQPDLFPAEVRKRLPDDPPEGVDFDEPPAKLLRRLYRDCLQREYKKVVDGQRLFSRVDPRRVC